MDSQKISLNAAIAVSGAVFIAVYIIFGDSLFSRAEPKRKIRRKGIIPGLANIGNTCFVNCVLQALASCSFFIKWLESKSENQELPLLCTLEKIIKFLNNKTEENIASAYDVLKALRSHGWVISAAEQDAHELFHALTATIDEEISVLKQQSNSLLNVSWVVPELEKTIDQSLNKPNNQDLLDYNYKQDSLKLGPAKYSNLTFLEEPCESTFTSIHLLKSSGKKVECGASIISKVPSLLKETIPVMSHSSLLESPFKGHLASQLKCSCCGFKNVEQWSSFESISLSLPDLTWNNSRSSLADLLRAFVQTECVTDVTCEGCSKTKGFHSQSTFRKQMTFGKLPECLCIHIQRTTWLENRSAIKRKDFVAIPEVLNMEPFTYTVSNYNKYARKGNLFGGKDTGETYVQLDTLSSLASSSKFDAPSIHAEHSGPNRYCWKSSSLYRLQAVIVHVGDVFSGHFVTYRRGPSPSNLKERWFYTSDLIVREVTLEEVLQSSAYMVFYEKISL